MSSGDNTEPLREPLKLTAREAWGHRPFVIGDKITDAPLEWVTALARYQVRTHLRQSSVRQYAKQSTNGSQPPALGVAWTGGETFFLVDGFHRRAALVLNETDTIPEIEIVALTERDAQRVALEANLGHGVPLSKKELRKSLKRHVKKGHHVTRRNYEGRPVEFQSLRTLASEVLRGHVSYSAVRFWLKEDCPREYKQMTAGIPREEFSEGEDRSRRINPQEEARKAGLDALEQVEPYTEALKGDPAAIEYTRNLLGLLEGEIDRCSLYF